MNRSRKRRPPTPPSSCRPFAIVRRSAGAIANSAEPNATTRWRRIGEGRRCVPAGVGCGGRGSGPDRERPVYAPAPHYAGESIEIHVVVKGFDEDPAPSVVQSLRRRAEN